MEDLLTEPPPPSRFFQEDLNSFTFPDVYGAYPFILFSYPKSKKQLRPSLLIIALSSPSQYLLHHITSKSLVGSLIIPEISVSGNQFGELSHTDKSCNIFALNDADDSTLFVSVQYPVTEKWLHPVSRLLLGNNIVPERVLILDTIQRPSFRGDLPFDETSAFKLETSAERKAQLDKGSSLLNGLDYFPSGSMQNGLGAALLTRCQLKNIKGTLCVTLPEFGPPAVALLKKILRENVLPRLDSILDSKFEEKLKVNCPRDRASESQMFT